MFGDRGRAVRCLPHDRLLDSRLDLERSEGINLTDQYENEFDDTGKNLPYYYHQQGREVLVGVRYQY